MKYLTRNYKLWIFYYIAFYFIIVIFPERPSNVVLWKYYFPFKTLVLNMAIWWANGHDELSKAKPGRSFDTVRMTYVIFSSVIILVLIPMMLCYIIKSITGMNLSFLITN